MTVNQGECDVNNRNSVHSSNVLIHYRNGEALWPESILPNYQYPVRTGEILRLRGNATLGCMAGVCPSLILLVCSTRAEPASRTDPLIGDPAEFLRHLGPVLVPSHLYEFRLTQRFLSRAKSSLERQVAVMEDSFRRATLGSGMFYRDPQVALQRLEDAFGFERTMVISSDKDGRLSRAEMRFGDS